MITATIVFNGKEYAGVEEMPADVRSLYDEALRHAGAMPAGAAPAGAGGVRVDFSTQVQTRIVFNGREYRSPEELPAELRPLYEQAMARAGLESRTGSRAAAHPVSLHPGSPHSASPHLDPRFSPRPVGPEAGSAAGRIIMKLAAAVVFALLLWWILGLVR